MVSTLIVLALVAALGWYLAERRHRGTGSVPAGLARDLTLSPYWVSN